MKHLLLSFPGLLLSLIAGAQFKSLTVEQAFKGKPPRIVQSPPTALKWIDDTHYSYEKTDSATNKPVAFIVDVQTGKVSAGSEMSAPMIQQGPAIYDAINVTISPDNKWAAYTKRDHNLYVTDLASKKETRLTSDGNDSLLNGYASWVYYEEILGRATHYRAFSWSPDSRHISFMQFNEANVPVFPIYWANGTHGFLENQRYPKAGDKNPAVKIGIVDIGNGKITWADFNANDDQYFGKLLWTPDNECWVQWMNRGQNHLIIYRVNTADGSKTPVYDDQQSTWIDLDDDDRIEFLESGKGFIVRSDKTGWRHFYLYDRKGNLQNAITAGDFTTGDIYAIDEKAGAIYFAARKENSARWDLYMASLDGKKMVRLSAGPYSYSNMILSPHKKYFITTYSNLNTPSTVVVMDMKGKLMQTIGDVKGPAFSEYALPKKELVRVKSADGLFDLPVSIIYPINFDPHKKYPVLVSIYGGPNAGTVYDQWRLSPTDLWWAQEGLVQVAFDNRSSGHFGKKGMNYIYHQMGKYEIEDFMACGRWVKQQPWAAENKLCITGGSFGGYMTCMALTYGASVFDYGLANSAVTSWNLYDTHYVERYMGLPNENKDGYKATSVLSYISKYKGLLRITHGTADDNVHMQNALQFINEMENAQKHFEMMFYPGERHGFGGLKGTHARMEAVEFYYRNLLEKPVPAGL